MAYLPPGLFDRLRVRCCSLEFEYYNWKDHVLLFVDDHRVLVKKHNYPPGAESTSPAIYIKGRGPKAELEALWEVLLRVVQVRLTEGHVIGNLSMSAYFHASSTSLRPA